MGNLRILEHVDIYEKGYQWEIPKPLVVSKLLLYRGQNQMEDDGPVITLFAEGKPKSVFDQGVFNKVAVLDRTVIPAFTWGETQTHTDIHLLRNGETSSVAPTHVHYYIPSWDPAVWDKNLRYFFNNLAILNYISRDEAQIGYLRLSKYLEV